MTSPPDNVEQLLESVGISPTFLNDLLHDSDWSFVIKVHALFEAVLSSLIVRRLGSDAAADAIAHLDFNNTKSGKVAFARALGLLNKEHVTFLRGLSELRNQLVHKVHNVTFTFEHHLEALDASELKKFKTEFGYAICGLDNGETQYEEMLLKKPKTIVLLAAYQCLLNLQFQITDRGKDILIRLLREGTRDA